MSNLDAFCPLAETLGVDNFLTGMSGSLTGLTDDGLSTAWQVFVNTVFEPNGFETPFSLSPDTVLGAEGNTCVDYLFTVPEPVESLGFLAALLTLGCISRVRQFHFSGNRPSIANNPGALLMRMLGRSS